MATLVSFLKNLRNVKNVKTVKNRHFVKSAGYSQPRSQDPELTPSTPRAHPRQMTSWKPLRTPKSGQIWPSEAFRDPENTTFPSLFRYFSSQTLGQGRLNPTVLPKATKHHF